VRVSAGHRFLPSATVASRGRTNFGCNMKDTLLQGCRALRGPQRDHIHQYGQRQGFCTCGPFTEYMLTPTWYLRGGYAYIWQDREVDPSDADNNQVFISVGYRGLSQPSRTGAQKPLAQ